MSLSQAPKGARVTIVSLNLQEAEMNRLTALGLIPGTRIRIIDNSAADTSLIECKGVRLALGRGLPLLIEVK